MCVCVEEAGFDDYVEGKVVGGCEGGREGESKEGRGTFCKCVWKVGG